MRTKRTYEEIEAIALQYTTLKDFIKKIKTKYYTKERMKYKIIISHPTGNENTRHAVLALYKKEMLGVFVT